MDISSDYHHQLAQDLLKTHFYIGKSSIDFSTTYNQKYTPFKTSRPSVSREAYNRHHATHLSFGNDSSDSTSEAYAKYKKPTTAGPTQSIEKNIHKHSFSMGSDPVFYKTTNATMFNEPSMNQTFDNSYLENKNKPISVYFGHDKSEGKSIAKSEFGPKSSDNSTFDKAGEIKRENKGNHYYIGRSSVVYETTAKKDFMAKPNNRDPRAQ